MDGGAEWRARPSRPAGARDEALPLAEPIDREELARGRRPPGEPPVEPRPAATIVLARRAGDPEGELEKERGFQVLLLGRPVDAGFAAGAYVFPGGTLDAGDAAPELSALLPPEHHAEGPALVAALRELFEETGFLLSDAPPPAAASRRARRDVLAGRRRFADVVRELGASFAGLRALYLSRWITPAGLARRYDARFFLAEASGWAEGAPELTPELESHVWVHPAEAVERFRAGRLPMLFPTRVTLEELAAFPTLEALRLARRGVRIEPIRPRLLVRGDSVRPVLPGDPGYEEAE